MVGCRLRPSRHDTCRRSAPPSRGLAGTYPQPVQTHNLLSLNVASRAGQHIEISDLAPTLMYRTAQPLMQSRRVYLPDDLERNVHPTDLRRLRVIKKRMSSQSLPSNIFVTKRRRGHTCRCNLRRTIVHKSISYIYHPL